MRRADYIADDCGCIAEFWFSATPPPEHLQVCSEHPDRKQNWKRIWTAPHLGRGSSGEPPR